MSETNQAQKDLEIFLPEGKEVQISGEKFYIKPFVLRNRIKVLKLVTETFIELNKTVPNIQSANQTALVGALVSIAGEKLIEVYEIVLGKDKEWLGDNIQLKDEIIIVQAIIEVNEFPLLLSQINLMFQGKEIQNPKN